MNGDALGFLGMVLDHAGAAMRAINSASMVAALIAFSAILAAVGGMFSWRMRLYGAIVGGMIVNALVKAEGGGYATALVAMLIATALGYALGSAVLLVRVMNLRRR